MIFFYLIYLGEGNNEFYMNKDNDELSEFIQYSALLVSLIFVHRIAVKKKEEKRLRVYF